MRFLPLILLACLLFPSPVLAGGYSVSACFGYENASWTEWEPSPFVTAYVACPGGVIDVRHPRSGQGLMVRNVVGSGHAPQGASAALRFDAPAGTTITGADFDVNMTSNSGWDAGIHDATHDRWLWCGPSCLSTFDRWMHQELRGLATQRIQALVRCVAVRCRRDQRHGFVTLRNARVYLEDSSAPRLDGARGALVAAGGAWLRGLQDVAFDAADNGGIRLGRVELDGRVVHDDARGCDFTRPVPCSNGAVGAAFDTRTWPDGEHVMRLAAQDAGGNWGWIDQVVRVDNTPPAEPAPALEGGDGWNPSRSRTVALPLPGGQAAPLTRARVRSCRVGGPCEESAPELRAGGVAVAAFDGAGEYSLRVALEDAAGNVGPYAPPLTLRFDDTRPGAPDLAAADAWHSGGALPLAASGQPPVSGIRGFRVRIGGRESVVATSLPLDELPEGVTPVEVSAISGAGVEGTAVRTTLKLDRSRPVAAAEGSLDGWSREPVRLTLRGRDQVRLSGVRSLAWKIGDGAEESAEGDAATVELTEDGRHTVAFRATDGAGNESEPRAVSVKIDRSPPETVAFEAPDPADPRRVRVVVADQVSGVAGGRIELRRAGGAWQRLKTVLEQDRLVALLDDAVLRAGAYELRARVIDVAGNEVVGTRRVDGTQAAVTLPLRRRTALSVHRVGSLLRARLTASGEPLGGRPVTLAQRLRGRSRWRDVCAKRTVVIGVPAGGWVAAHGWAARRATSGRTGSGSAADCVLRTDSAGRIEVRVPAGPSRTLRLAFGGDALLLPARGTTVIRTPARAWLTAARAPSARAARCASPAGCSAAMSRAPASSSSSRPGSPPDGGRSRRCDPITAVGSATRITSRPSAPGGLSGSGSASGARRLIRSKAP